MTSFEIKCCLSDMEASKVEQAKCLIKSGYQPWGLAYEAHITLRQARAVYESCHQVQL